AGASSHKRPVYRHRDGTGMLEGAVLGASGPQLPPKHDLFPEDARNVADCPRDLTPETVLVLAGPDISHAMVGIPRDVPLTSSRHLQPSKCNMIRGYLRRTKL